MKDLDRFYRTVIHNNMKIYFNNEILVDTTDWDENEIIFDNFTYKEYIQTFESFFDIFKNKYKFYICLNPYTLLKIKSFTGPAKLRYKLNPKDIIMYKKDGFLVKFTNNTDDKNEIELSQNINPENRLWPIKEDDMDNFYYIGDYFENEDIEKIKKDAMTKYGYLFVAKNAGLL